MFHFVPSENIRKSKVFWCFQGDQKETLGRKGLSGNCVVIYIRRIKCPNSHLELLPGNIFLAIKVSSVFSQILFENDGCFFVPKQVDLPWSRTWYDKKTYRFHSISLQYCISYRNQSFDLQSKSNDWFPYEIQNWAEVGLWNGNGRSWNGHRRSFIWSVRKIFRKTNISYPLLHTNISYPLTHTYQGVRSVSFWKKIKRRFKILESNSINVNLFNITCQNINAQYNFPLTLIKYISFFGSLGNLVEPEI